MREIKFRAWHVELKKMCSAEEMGVDELTLSTNSRGFVNVSSVSPKLSHYIGEQMIPLQYTGLKDRNGKDIYEGDIVEWTIFPYEEEPKRIKDYVSFGSGCFKVEKRGELLGLKEPHRQLEVIGNIYENVDLLK